MWQLRAPFSLLGYLEHANSRITRLPTEGGGRCKIADLNGDGYLDIVFGNYMHNYRPDQPAYIYWGSAQGFRKTSRTELPAYLAGGVAVGDLNGDGLQEVVLANHGDESGETWGFAHHLESYIYWGNLNGYDISRRTSIPTISAADVAMGDFNGDGFPDLAFVNYNSQEQSVYVYWGDGKGGFSEQRRQVLRRSELRLPATGKAAFGWSDGMKTLLAAELNGDRYMDLAVGGTGNALIFPGSARGLEIERAVDLPARNCEGMDVSDLNRDGHLDLILANQGTYRKAPPASVIYWGSAQGYRADRLSGIADDGGVKRQSGRPQPGRVDRPSVRQHHRLGRQRRPVADLLGRSGRVCGASTQRAAWRLGNRLRGGDLNRDGETLHPAGQPLERHGVLPSSILWGTRTTTIPARQALLLDPGGEMEDSVADLDDDS